MNWLAAIIAGLAGTAVMPMMMRMHPRPPQMDGGSMIMVGHLVYGLVVALVYTAF